MTGGPYLCDEVGVGHEELLHDVDDCKNGSQFVLQSQFGGFGCGRGLPAFCAAAAALLVNTGSAGLYVR